MDRIEFINVDINNQEHFNILKSISESNHYLGDISGFNFKSADTFYNNSYMVIIDNNIIGFLSLSDIVETRLGNNVTIFYGILKEYYGNGYGKKIVEYVKNNLKSTNVDFIIAQVDLTNEHGKKIVESCDFKVLYEDDEDLMYGYKMK